LGRSFLYVAKQAVALPRALKILAIPPAVVSAGWVFSCFLLLATSTFLLRTQLATFPSAELSSAKENPTVLAAEDQREQPQPNPPPKEEQIPDERITILEQFLNEQGSPLANQAAALIEAADTYKFDWRLLPAIAGKESSYGKNIPWEKDKSSYNAWGWGVYGQKAPRFSSWEKAINTVAAGLRHEYYNEGYITPELIVKKFAPRSYGSWERDVKTIMEQIAQEQFFPL